VGIEPPPSGAVTAGVAVPPGTFQTRRMTMPAPEDDERDARPLGSDAAQDDDRASGVAGPSYPPEETEPDAS
jgi:hypothetical protein